MHKPVETSSQSVPQSQAPRLPLSRFKVIDLTLARAGPSCVRTLADWGADVIRVEPPPVEGEANELVGRRDGSDFQNLHRNKRAITLNLKTDEGREILMRLAEKADVVIENMRPGVTRRLGVDYRVRQEAQSEDRLWQHFRLRPVRSLYRAALDRPDRAGHDRHHVGDGPSRPGPGPRRRRRHRHHGRRLPRAGRADRAARPRSLGRRPLGADLADRIRHHAAGFPGHALADGQEDSAAGRQQPSHQLADGPLSHRRRLSQPRRHQQQEFPEILQADRPRQDGNRSALCHDRRCAPATRKR